MLVMTGAAAFTAIGPPTAAADDTLPPTKPNIVILLIDDFPAMDNRVFERLPNIKATFLDQGVSFTNYWANFSLCCPGRAALLSGQRDDHNGVMQNKAALFDPTETIATELQADGYYTGIVGKYFNGTSTLASKTPPGWDYVAIKDDGPYYKYPEWTNGVREYHGTLATDYSVDVMSAKSSAFFDQVPSDEPVFAYLTPNATHGGADADGTSVAKQPVPAPRFVDDPRCANIAPYKPAGYDRLNSGPVPAYEKSLPPMTDALGWDLTRSCEALLAVDEWFGNVIDALTIQGRYENTIFVLASDNGMGWGAHRVTGKIAPYTAQMPLRISWPAVIGPTTRQDATLVSNIDIAPTLCDIAGCQMGPYPNGYSVDGSSFAGLIDPTLFSSVPNRNSIVVEGVGGGVPFFEAIMTGANHPLGQWLFVRYSTGEKELYNVSGGPCFAWSSGAPGDPCMLSNVTRSRPNVRKKLAAELTAEWGTSAITMTSHPATGHLDGRVSALMTSP
jgi:arylsulfatase A-like enzyme